MTTRRIHMNDIPASTKRLLIIASVVAIALRILSALRGDNYDMESWWLVSEGILSGKSVYSTTFRYNYGPVWAYILAALRWLSSSTGADTITRLHLFIAAFLGVVDCALAWYVMRRSSIFLAALFLFNPISVLVSGYHVQFDNLAILIGLLAWEKFLVGTTTRDSIKAGLLFGASLATKHIFAIFLPWILFATMVRQKKERFLFCSTSMKVFILSFAPFIIEPESAAGITNHVLRYISTEGHTIVRALNVYSDSIPDRTLFVILLAGLGVYIARRIRDARDLPLLYLCALTALSSGMARNYLAIPLIAVVLWAHTPLAWAYVVASLLALTTVNNHLGVSEVAFVCTNLSFITYEAAQTLLVLLFVMKYRNLRESERVS